MTTKEMPVRALAPWFGSGRMIAEAVGKLLKGCDWVGVPFAGGMSELAEIEARALAVNDLHRHVINLARVVKDRDLQRELLRELRRTIFHPDTLRDAQTICREAEPGSQPDLRTAWAYFVCCWMGRSHKAGGVDEFNGGPSTRWSSTGGDSVTRFRNAAASLAAWSDIMQRCSFSTLDAFEFLAKCKDIPNTGIYVDAPWPDDGAKYRHKFTEQQQRDLAAALARFENARIVIRYGDHPLIRELYAADCWQWNAITGRTQTNEAKSEVLITNVRGETLF